MTDAEFKETQRLLAGLIAMCDDARRDVEALRTQRDDLMRVLEPLLIEVEPLRYQQRQDIEQACIEKREWADHVNATRPPGSEPWAFMTEYRRSLEEALEPLCRAVRDANDVFDRVAALARSGTTTETRP